MRRLGLRLWVVVCVVAVSLVWCRTRSNAIYLDSGDTMKLGVRTYVNARVGTERTHIGASQTSGTFPRSAAGHLRQNRAFIEVELNHDLKDLLKEGEGPLSLLNDLPFRIKGLAYHFTFRGEADSLYDWGPREYSTADEFRQAAFFNPPLLTYQIAVPVAGARKQLRKLGTDRERLFQAYVEARAGSLFLRVGRQILSWGETDGFRLLDSINPLDSSFGGFLISLDERRVPLDMGLAQYYLGDFGPFTDMFVEGYAAFDNSVGYYPGTPAGSPWALPSLGNPSNQTLSINTRPARTFNNVRGGGRLVFNAFDATFSVAHYYTHVDTPALQVYTPNYRPGTRPVNGVGNVFDDGLPCPSDPSQTNCGYPTHAVQTAPKVQVSGATTTFALPQFYSVVRGEVAYFKDEPAFTQRQLDPFLFYLNPDGTVGGTTGGRRLRDSFSAVIGLDINQWIRAINPHQTFFISTQFFYKHILNHAGNSVLLPPNPLDPPGTVRLNPDREVLPVTRDLVNVPANAIPGGGAATRIPLAGNRLEPLFVTQPADQYLQTLFIGTSFRSGTVSPGFTLFYDWGGAFLYQPSLTITRDPFRFAIDYSIIDAHTLKGGSGVSLLKDRDNIQFRFEYVI